MLSNLPYLTVSAVRCLAPGPALLPEGHRRRFAEWEWRDEHRRELEIIRALERDGLEGAKLSGSEQCWEGCCGWLQREA